MKQTSLQSKIQVLTVVGVSALALRASAINVDVTSANTGMSQQTSNTSSVGTSGGIGAARFASVTSSTASGTGTSGSGVTTSRQRSSSSGTGTGGSGASAGAGGSGSGSGTGGNQVPSSSSGTGTGLVSDAFWQAVVLGPLQYLQQAQSMGNILSYTMNFVLRSTGQGGWTFDSHITVAGNSNGGGGGNGGGSGNPGGGGGGNGGGGSGGPTIPEPEVYGGASVAGLFGLMVWDRVRRRKLTVGHRA